MASSTCTDADGADRRSLVAYLSDTESVGSVSRGLKRGRPSTTSKYVGLAAARAKTAALDWEELRLQAEREVVREQRNRRVAASTRSTKSVEPSDGGLPEAISSSGANPEGRVGDLATIVKDDLEVIRMVATKSSNLKGTYVKSLKDAASSIGG